jgi:hypothetical protein
MKKLHALALAAAVLALGSAPSFAQSTTFQNGTFDTGLSGWDTLGDVSVGLFAGGNPRAVLTTAYFDPLDPNAEEGLDNKSGVSAADISLIEPFAGVAPFALDVGGPAYEGSVMRQTFSVMAGDAISFNFWFSLLTQQPATPGFPADVGFVSVNGNVISVLDPMAAIGMGAFSYQFATGGLANVAIGVLDIGDYVGNTELRVDNITVSAVPEPETIAMLLAGLGVVAGAASRRKLAAKVAV